jgi:hypothetical protein
MQDSFGGCSRSEFQGMFRTMSIDVNNVLMDSRLSFDS